MKYTKILLALICLGAVACSSNKKRGPDSINKKDKQQKTRYNPMFDRL